MSVDLVGRERETELLRQALARSSLVQVVGPTGVGKTALVEAAVADTPAHWCDVASAASESDLRSRVAAALGLGSGAIQVGDDPVAVALSAEARPVLVLDGAEAASAAWSRTIARWRVQHPGLAVVVTASARFRPRIDIVTIELAPLPTTARGKAVTSVAGRLLVEVASRARGGDALSSAEQRAAQDLAVEADGLPLALTLLGGLARSWRLDEVLSQLRSGSRESIGAATAIAETLRNSFDRLSPGSQATVRAAALFRGGLTIESLTATLRISSREALRRVDDLLDASWLVRVEATTEGGPARFRVLRSVVDWLDNTAQPSERARTAFVRYFADCARLSTEDLRFGSASSRRWLLEERYNLEHALLIAPEREEESRVIIASALARVGRDETLAPAIWKAVQAAPGRKLPRGPVRSEWCAACALLRSAFGDSKGAAEMLSTSGSALSPVTAHARASLSFARHDYDAAIRLAKSLARTRSRGAPAMAAFIFGIALYSTSRYSEATEALADAETAFNEADLELLGLEAMALRACCEVEQGALRAGEAHASRARAGLLALRHYRYTAVSALYVALARLESGDHEGARSMAEEALVLAKRTGFRSRVALTRGYLGVVEHEGGHLEAAREAYELALEEGASPATASLGLLRSMFLARLASVEAEVGDLVAAEKRAARVAVAEAAPPGIQRTTRIHLAIVAAARARAASGSIAANARQSARAWLEGDPVDSWDERSARRLLARVVGGVGDAAFEVDPTRQTVTLPSGRQLVLHRKPIAFAILAALCQRPSMRKEDLCLLVWNRRKYDPLRDDARLHMAITRVRKLIGDDAQHPTWLLTTEDGYRLRP